MQPAQGSDIFCQLSARCTTMLLAKMRARGIVKFMHLSRPQAIALRKRFLRKIGPDTPFYRLLDHLPEIAFFAKDRQFRLVCASQSFLDRFGFRDEMEIVGRDDFELFPERLAENFRRDDEEVMTTATAKLNIVELFFNEQGVPDWFITNKLPIRDTRGRVTGIMGTVHSYSARRDVLHPYFQLDRAITYIRKHFRTGVSVKELAHAIHTSPRQLHRKFVAAFGSSPQTFIMKLRIQAACEALQREDAEIPEIAFDHGFCSQSAFTQMFQKYVGTTPLKYQKRFQLERGATD
jgi:PAS domain S-box-containing protein